MWINGILSEIRWTTENVFLILTKEQEVTINNNNNNN